MEHSRKQLKNFSILVIILAGLTILNLAFELLFGELNNAEISAGLPENTLLITKIFAAVISFIMILPQIYIGFKGLKMAKNPDSSKAHIVWGVILFVFTVISLFSYVVDIFKLKDVFANVATIMSVAVDATILFNYVKYARRVSKGI